MKLHLNLIELMILVIIVTLLFVAVIKESVMPQIKSTYM